MDFNRLGAESISGSDVIIDRPELIITNIEGAASDDPRRTRPTKLEIKEENGKIKRSSFACVSCHSLKQKCIPSDVNDIYRKPCQRCFRQKKTCTFDLSKRTRKRKTHKIDNFESSISPTISPPGSSMDIKNTSNSSAKRNHLVTNQENESLYDREPGIKKPRSMNAILNGLLSQKEEMSNVGIISNPIATATTNSTMLPGIQSLSGIWPYTGSNSNVPTATMQETQVFTQVDPSRTTGMVINGDMSNMPVHNQLLGRKHGIHSGAYHLNHTFKKQLQSLLLNQKEKSLDLSNKFTAWSDRWNDVVQNTMFLPAIKDPISIGIISTNEANIRLQLYRNEISTLGKLSFIKIPDTVTVDQLRADKPILFSVIMSIVSIIMKEDQTNRETIMKLDSFVINLLTNQIFKVNNKSIEIIEAHIVLCTWYNFLEWSNKTRYHLFNYICCCLTKDLGPMFVNRLFAMFSDDEPKEADSKLKSPLELYPSGARIILLVYITSLNISIFLKQTIQMKYGDLVKLAADKIQQQIDEHFANKTNVYHGGTYGLEDDIVLLSFVQLNHTLENIHVYLHEMTELFDEDDNDLKDKYTNRLIEKYRLELIDIFENLPKHRIRLVTFYYSVEAYFHQFKIKYYIRKLSEMKKNLATNEQEFEIIRNNAVQSFVDCYTCCISCLQEFSKLTPGLIASIPLFLMSRLIYTVGLLLLRLRFSVIAFPIFHHLLDMTDRCVPIVNNVRELLNESIVQYPYNSFLYKFQYVIILFVQTYANKVIDLLEATSGSTKPQVNSGSSLLDESVQLNPLILYNRSDKVHWNKKKREHTRSNMNESSDVIGKDFTAECAPSIDQKAFRNPTPVRNPTNNNYISNNLVNANELLGLNLVGNNYQNNIDDRNNNLEKSASSMSLGNIGNNPGGNNGSDMRSSSPSLSAASENLNDYLTDINSLTWGYTALNDEFWTDLFINDM